MLFRRPTLPILAQVITVYYIAMTKETLGALGHSDSFCKYRNMYIAWSLLHILKNVCVFSISFKATFRLLLFVLKQKKLP